MKIKNFLLSFFVISSLAISGVSAFVINPDDGSISYTKEEEDVLTRVTQLAPQYFSTPNTIISPYFPDTPMLNTVEVQCILRLIDLKEISVEFASYMLDGYFKGLWGDYNTDLMIAGINLHNEMTVACLRLNSCEHNLRMAGNLYQAGAHMSMQTQNFEKLCKTYKGISDLDGLVSNAVTDSVNDLGLADDQAALDMAYSNYEQSLCAKNMLDGARDGANQLYLRGFHIACDSSNYYNEKKSAVFGQVPGFEQQQQWGFGFAQPQEPGFGQQPQNPGFEQQQQSPAYEQEQQVIDANGDYVFSDQ